MIISDIDYLSPITETSATHLIGGFGFSALAVADFFALASSSSSVITADVQNKAVSLPGSSSASSSVKVTAFSPVGNSITSASASSFASISPLIFSKI